MDAFYSSDISGYALTLIVLSGFLFGIGIFAVVNLVRILRKNTEKSRKANRIVIHCVLSVLFFFASVFIFNVALDMPKQKVFSGQKVSEQVEPKYGESFKTSDFFDFIDLASEVFNEECFTNNKCEKGFIRHNNQQYFVKFSEDEGLYLIDSETMKKVPEDDSTLVDTSDLKQRIEKETKLTDVEVTMNDSQTYWNKDIQKPQDSPIRVSGVLDGVYTDNLIFAMDKDKIRLIPSGTTTQNISEKDLVK